MMKYDWLQLWLKGKKEKKNQSNWNRTYTCILEVYTRARKESMNDDVKCKCRIGLKPIESA